MTDVVMWLLLVEGLAWAWFGLTGPLFASWPDRGLGLSKAGGVLSLAGLVWIGASIGLPLMSGPACWMLTALLAAAAVFVARRNRRTLNEFPRPRQAWLTAQALWIAVLAVFLCLRAAAPELTGGEKFMDVAMLNTSVRATNLPPLDPWLAGFPLNYYYFGYIAWAVPTKMLAVDTAVAYNLAMGVIPALVAAGAFSVGLAATRRVGPALLASVALVAIGNFAGVVELLRAAGPYDLWAPTRVIPGTINEFPFFSFYWGDLHPHVLAMPVLVLYVGLLMAWLDSPIGGVRRLVLALAVGACAGVAVMTSVWEVAPAGVLALAAASARARHQGLRAVIGEGVTAAVAAVAVVLPALLTLEPPPVAIGLAAETSPIGAFLLVQGGWILPVTLLWLYTLGRGDTPRAYGILLPVGTGLAAGLASGSVTVGVLAGLTTAFWSAAWRARSDARIVWMLSASAVMLLVVAELVYVDDAYGAALQRMNVVFKLQLQACVLFALSWAGIWNVFRETAGPRARVVAVGALVAIALPSSAYPGVALTRRLVGPDPWTLDGAAYLARQHPGDGALVDFLNRTVPGQPTIVEAVSDPYSQSARISSFTGLPAVLGWANHEYLWRREPAMTDVIARRAEAVRRLYEGSAADAASALTELSPRYVVVGEYERQTYPGGDFGKFASIGRRVFDEGGTQLFEISDGAGAR